MGFLPFPDPPGISIALEIVFVPGFDQPSFLAGLFPGLLARGLGTKTLPCPMPVIRKKKFVAVQAFTAAFLSLHRVQKSNAGRWENQIRKGRKSKRKKNQNCEEGRKLFSEFFEENPGEEDPFLNHPFCATLISPLTPCPDFARARLSWSRLCLTGRNTRPPISDAFTSAAGIWN
jgi:hypothetical protein